MAKVLGRVRVSLREEEGPGGEGISGRVRICLSVIASCMVVASARPHYIGHSHNTRAQFYLSDTPFSWLHFPANNLRLRLIRSAHIIVSLRARASDYFK